MATVDANLYPMEMQNRFTSFMVSVDQGVHDYDIEAKNVADFDIDMNSWRTIDKDMIQHHDLQQEVEPSIFDTFDQMPEQEASLDVERTIDR